jgi:hypothetical protein
MHIDESVCDEARAVWERKADSIGLPKHVRFLGAGRLYEFEVVAGNASYREGERFYLTPAQARRAYFPDREMS